MADLEILGMPQSNFVWATRIAAAAKGVPHTNLPEAPHSTEIAAIHPLGRIPVLRHGDVKIAESLAIIRYLDRSFEGPKLSPDDPKKAIDDDSWSSMIITTIEPVIIRQYLFAYVFPGTENGMPDRQRIEDVMPKVEDYLTILEKAADEDAINAETITVTDCFLIPILYYANTLPESKRALGRCPNLASYLERQLEKVPVKETIPPPPPTSS